MSAVLSVFSSNRWQRRLPLAAVMALALVLRVWGLALDQRWARH